MNELKTLKELGTVTNTEIVELCSQAKELEDAGEYEAAARVLGTRWQGVGRRPNLTGLSRSDKAALLARSGALSGWIGSMKLTPGSQDKAKDLISEAATIFKDLGYTEDWADAISDLAVCYWREGSYDNARVFLLDVINSNIELSPQISAKILLRLVNVEISTCDYSKAMSVIEDAAPLVEKHGNDLLRGKLYFHRALILHCQGEDEHKTDRLFLAADDYQLARRHYKKVKHMLYTAHVESNLGNVYRLLNDNDSAHAHIEEALRMYIKLDFKGKASTVCDNKAQLFLAEGLLNEAEKAARTAVKLVRNGEEKSALAESLTTLGTILSRRGNFAEAIHSFVEAKETALSTENKESAGNAVLTQIEELQADLSPSVFRALYLEADELLKDSPRPGTVKRLRNVAKKQFELLPLTEDSQPLSEGSTDSQKMAKLLRYADKLDSLFENKAGGAFDWETFSLPDAVRTYEGEIILKALTDSSGRVTKAAQLLGVSHQNLSLILHQRHKDLKKYCVQRKPRSRSKVKVH